MKEYKGVIPDNIRVHLGKIRLRHLLTNKNCIVAGTHWTCPNSSPTCETCLFVHPSWRRTIDKDMRESLIEYLLDNNYLSKADALEYVLRRGQL